MSRLQTAALRLCKELAKHERPPLRDELPYVQFLRTYVIMAYPIDDFPRNGSPPIMRTLSGFLKPYESEIHYCFPAGLTEEALLGWVLLLLGLHPNTTEEKESMEKACIQVIAAYNEDPTTNVGVLRPFWHLIAE